MGKGDLRSKKGKMKNGSFGRSRNKRVLKSKNSPKKAA
ncbi:MAG: 30S ribosomal protein THX [Bacteroidia bacterium]|jgi:ribosomal small subunit protein bTHX|nr:30S ribosomal protein THX [Bacteroidia bacterium]